MDDPVQDKILQIVARFAGTKKPIPLSTSINNDLSINGDDAYELLVVVKNELQTNFDDLVFDRYFWNETESFIWPSIWKFLRLRGKDNLTVQHLANVVKKGAWFD